jgi:uncharacterized protein (TIGR02757 family)
MTRPVKKFSIESLEDVYSRYNHRRFIHPDPLEFLYLYTDPEDVELVALIASSLAYGRVQQILKSVSVVLQTIESPASYVQSTTKTKMKRDFRNFKHRFTTGDQMAQLLVGAGRAIKQHGSLGNCFAMGIDENDKTVEKALSHFADQLLLESTDRRSSLIPNPKKGSACKRLNLLLRWMVRKDDVDPGGWAQIDKSKLIIPLDTHMHRIAIEHGMTRRKNADMRAALEITKAFSIFCPTDPVRYDFSLTRPDIGGH